MNQRKSSYNWPLLFTAFTLGLLLALYARSAEFRDHIQALWDIMQSGNYERISTGFREMEAWGPLVIVLTMVVQMFLVVIPSWGLMVVSVLVYGPVWGTLLAILAVLVASTVGYFIGKVFGKTALRRIIGRDTSAKLTQFVERYGFGAVFLFRLSPLLSSDAVSLAGGMLHMRFWRFLLATLLGITPLAVAIAYFGSEADRLKTGLYWLGGVGLLLYLLYILWDYKYRRREE